MVQKKRMSAAEHPDAGQVRLLATSIGGFDSFAELAAVTLARSFLRKKRPRDAQRVIASYMFKYPPSAKLTLLMAELA